MAEICQIIFGILGAPVKIKQYVLDPIKTQFRYLCRHNIIIQDLRDERGRLTTRRDRLQENIRAAERNNQIINTNVNEWLFNVGNLEEKITRILSHEPQDGTCLQGTCPNLKVRYSRSRKAMKLIPRIDELIVQCDNFGNDISHPPPTTGIETIPMTFDTRQFDSRKQMEEEIMSYLRDHSTFMIGVCGMGGVGKTTMATKIAERAKEDNLFDEIVMADVTQEVDRLKIQQQLAAGLNLVLTKDVVPVCARELYTRLMNNNVLIILDDVWERLNIAELGIPPQIKILLTTRDRRVCHSMSTERPTKMLTLGLLNEVEAFALFRDKTGSVVDQPNLRPIAMNVARECKGLPLALAIFGGALAGENYELIWEAFLRQLQKSAPTNIDGDLYPRLELSYHALKSEEDKYLFLLCCLFPEDSYIEIEDLVRYGVGLPNFSATESIIDVRDKVNLIVRKLVARCLLMDAGDESWPRYVKMHDVIRDMALLIASRREHKFKVSHDKGLREWPHESYTCISLTLGEAMTFQEGMRCPGLKALLLTFDLSSTTPNLPGNFLNGMADLTLLKIDGKRGPVLRLPLSCLSSLTKLRVLLLHNCGFEDTDISFLGQVKNLEILSCRESDIQELPYEIIALRKLKLLDMTGCWKLKNIAPGVIPALVKLEELRLMGCPIKWERQETGDERRSASLAEVFSLKNLWFLGFWIKDLEVISQEMDYPPKLTSYSISIGPGGEYFWGGSYNNPKRMSVCVDERMVFSDAISKLIEDVKELKLKGTGCKGTIELLGREGFVNITSLEIDRLGDVKILVERMDRVIFPNLRHLKLYDMSELEEICNGHPQVGSFSELKEITIRHCAKLKWVFPLSIAESLSKLESMEVSFCPIVEEVFKESESGITTANRIKFPNLKNMGLWGVPELDAWCKAVDAIIEFPSIKSLNITQSNFKIFGNLQLADQVTCTKFKYRSMGNHAMEIFYREMPIGFFSGVERLEIESFHRLRVLFSLVVFKHLINLKELIVEDCKMLEDIVEMENEDEEHTNVTIQKLEELQLSKLPKICYFWPFTYALEFPSLETVSITDCPMMETFAVVHSGCSSNMPSSSIPKFLGQQVTCTNLKCWTVRNLAVEIFYREVPFVFFSGIEKLEIESFHRLRVLFSLVVFKGLINLKELIVKDCTMLENIVEMENVDEAHTNVIIKTIIIQKLENLQLSKLPKICYFWPFSDALQFPSLKRVGIRDCPMMGAFAVDRCSSNMPSSSIPKFFGQQVPCTQLKELFMSTHPGSGISSFHYYSPLLVVFHVESSHNLKTLFSPAIFRALGNLCKLTVKDCMMLEDIVEMEKDEDAGHRNDISKISHLNELKLSKLPKIRCFGHFRYALEFPSLEMVTIEDCPKMETFVGEELWSSSSMSSGSIPARNFFNKQVTFTKLRALTMSQFSMEISPIGFFSGLETLHIESFHSLRILFSPAILKALGNLRKLTVKDCEMLEDIVEMEKDEDEGHRNNISKISHLKELQLSKLPKIRYFGHFRYALELPSLETVTIEDCPKMETFVGDELWSSSNMSRGSIPARNFFNKQVTCPKLKYLRLEGLKFSGLLFSPETPIASLGALYLLKIKTCHNLKSLFTSRMFEGLTSLCRVRVTDCSLFEEVIAKDENENENVDEMVVNIPKVKSLHLRELPKLRRFFHTRRDIELSSVQFIDLRGCTEIMKSGSFCLGGGSVRIPTGVRVRGISDTEFASQFFFPTQSLDPIQHLQEEDSLDDGCFMLLSSDVSFIWDSNEDLSVVKGTSNAFFHDRWKKACGKFDMEKLSPGITYEVVFAIMLFKLSHRAKDYLLETMMGDDKREHEVKDVPRQRWIEILVGELTPSSGQCGDITFSLQKNTNYTRVALKCASIRPKRIASDAR